MEMQRLPMYHPAHAGGAAQSAAGPLLIDLRRHEDTASTSPQWVADAELRGAAAMQALCRAAGMASMCLEAAISVSEM